MGLGVPDVPDVWNTCDTEAGRTSGNVGRADSGAVDVEETEGSSTMG